MSNFEIITYYKFVSLPHYEELQLPIKAFCERQRITGIILLAKEGINSTVAGSPKAIAALKDYFKTIPEFADFTYKTSYSEKQPFAKMKVRLKKEIVTLGVEGINPNAKIEKYIPPKEWNALISDPEVVLIDTRNTYETHIGTFDGAIDPQIANFKEFPQYIRENYDPKTHKKVAMFCTGGIRCEKATSMLLEEGFESVYHLEGGILKYLEEIPEEQSLWKGDCFVFDERVAVQHGLKSGDYVNCPGCGNPVNAEERQRPEYEWGVCCHHCKDSLSEEQLERFRHRHQQRQLAK